MNRFFLLLVFTVTLSCNPSSDKMEDELYACFTNSLSQKEMQKLNAVSKAYENYLIEQKVLESTDAKSYWNFYKKIAESGAFEFANDFNFSEKTRFLARESLEANQAQLDCYNLIFQSEMYLKSKQHQLQEEIQSLRKHLVTPKIIAQTTIQILSADDFEFEYNRLMTLLFIETFDETYKHASDE
ncbi:MAG: hypothetical protein AAGL29_11695 [Bacteroidota bacterium]